MSGPKRVALVVGGGPAAGLNPNIWTFATEGRDYGLEPVGVIGGPEALVKGAETQFIRLGNLA